MQLFVTKYGSHQVQMFTPKEQFLIGNPLQLSLDILYIRWALFKSVWGSSGLGEGVCGFQKLAGQAIYFLHWFSDGDTLIVANSPPGGTKDWDTAI